ncbi:MAG: ribbon-helix-helix protein, CopG family [Thermodesulfobacteriota bacterium]
MTTSTTFRTEAEKLERVDALAESMQRSRNWLINKAVDDLLEYHEWFLAEVEKGKQSAAAGRFASPEQVETVFAKYRRK